MEFQASQEECKTKHILQKKTLFIAGSFQISSKKMKSSHNTIGKKIIKIHFELIHFFCKTRLNCKTYAHQQIAKNNLNEIYKIIGLTKFS